MLRTAKTENGVVKGLPATNVRVTVYKGIPFAAPPVGKNRWKAPQPCPSWEGEYEAYTFKNIAMQDTPGIGDTVYQREWSIDTGVPMGEDCLYLNVWTPANSVDDNLPVLVWIYGGGFQWGYPYEMEFDGENLAKRGVIVVSVNYRLGAFGFFAHPEITKESPDAPANFGTLDQQAGIAWVKRNIKAFGGNPDNITVAGQSAGGASVMNQLVYEGNRDKINRAIIMSGIIRNPYVSDNFITPQSLSDAEEKGKSFLEFLGVNSVDEAREIPAITLRDKYTEYAGNHARFSPCIDGEFIKDDPVKMIMRGDYVDVPLMAGNTKDEFHVNIPKEDLERAGGLKSISGIEAAVKAVFDSTSKLGKNNGYYYCFDVDIPGWDNPGTFHSVDLWFFFESLNKCWRPMVGRHYDVARKMCNYWAEFMKNGDPNGKDCDGTDMPVWKPYSLKEPNEMQFKPEGPVSTVDTSEFNKYLVEKIEKK